MQLLGGSLSVPAGGGITYYVDTDTIIKIRGIAYVQIMEELTHHMPHLGGGIGEEMWKIACGGAPDLISNAMVRSAVHLNSGLFDVSAKKYPKRDNDGC